MADFRVSFIFEAGRAGWSEQWYRSGSDADDVLNLLNKPAFINGFLAPRGAGVYLIGTRVNNVIVSRDTRLQILNLNSAQINPAPANDGEEPAVAALGYLRTTTGRKRSVMLRGLIDAEVTRDDADNIVFTAALLAALQKWKQSMLSVGMKVRVLTAPEFDNPERQVTLMKPSPNDSQATNFTYLNNVPLVDKKPIIFHHLPRSTFPGYGGAIPCFNVTATTFDVPIPWRFPLATIPLRLTTVRQVAYTYDLMQDVAWIDMRTKRTGRPSFVARGRRPGVKYRSR